MTAQDESLFHELFAQRTSRGAFHGVVDSVVNTFVQGGDRVECGGPHHGQIIQQVGNAPAHTHGGTLRQHVPQFGCLSKGMGPWQKGQTPVRWFKVIATVHHGAQPRMGIASQVAVYQFHTLGFPSCARCVNQIGQIVGSWWNDLNRFLLFLLQESSGKGMVGSSGCIETKTSLYERCVGQDFLADLVVNGFRGTKETGATRIIENVRPIGGELGFVHGNNGGIERMCRTRQCGPFPTVVGNDANLGMLSSSYPNTKRERERACVSVCVLATQWRDKVLFFVCRAFIALVATTTNNNKQQHTHMYTHTYQCDSRVHACGIRFD